MLTVAALNGTVLPIRLLILCVDSLMVQGGYVIQFFFLVSSLIAAYQYY